MFSNNTFSSVCTECIQFGNNKVYGSFTTEQKFIPPSREHCLFVMTFSRVCFLPTTNIKFLRHKRSRNKRNTRHSLGFESLIALLFTTVSKVLLCE